MNAGDAAADGRRLKVAVLYHYMHPDDVVSALHLDGLAQSLAELGWCVEALPCNRGCRDETLKYCSRESYMGVEYKRVWRPAFRQSSFFGRLANSAWMISAWSILAFRKKNNRPDVVVVGTDPMFGVITAYFLRLFSSKLKIVHWCFDMHPEAAIAEGVVAENSFLVRLVKFALTRSYRRCDMIADLGFCMRQRLRQYEHGAREKELTPWALVEPDEPVSTDPDTRKELFGDARIGILYSGNFGEAHDYKLFLALARELRRERSIHFCFAIRGNRAEEFRSAVTDDDVNVSFAGFAPIEELPKRLGSADIHLVSLKDEWTGIAVPSKFFGSIASGRPVLYAGPDDSAIAKWIEKHGVGWTLNTGNIIAVAEMLIALSRDQSVVDDLKLTSSDVYKTNFSRSAVTGEFDREMRKLLET